MSIHLLTGDDESNLRAAVTELVHELVGDADRSLMVDEFDGVEYTLREVVDSAQTPPFLTESRVVVARGIGRFVAADIDVMKAYLADPLPTTHLVLVGGGGAVTKPLVDAVKSGRRLHEEHLGVDLGRDLETWVRSRLEVKGLHFDQPALTRLLDWLGENTSTLDGLLDTVAAAHSGRSKVQLAELEPSLVRRRCAPNLTDAIDGGDVARSITLLHRMMHGGGRHPLQVMAILHGHYAKMARLDGSGASDPDGAATALGGEELIRGRQVLNSYRRLGVDGVRRAIGLLASADLDLRGETGLDEETVMEILGRAPRAARACRSANGWWSTRQLSGSARVDALHEAALATSRRVLVNDTLTHRGVETLHRRANGGLVLVGADSGLGLLDARLQLAAHSAIALRGLGVGEDSLLLALDVGHGHSGLIHAATRWWRFLNPLHGEPPMDGERYRRHPVDPTPHR